MTSEGQTSESTPDMGSTSSAGDINKEHGSVSSSSRYGGFSSSGRTGESGGSSAYSSSEGTTKGQSLSKKETEHVNRLRWIVLLILFCTGVGVSVLVFLLSRRSFEEEMKSNFESAAARLEDAFDDIRTQRIATLASMSIAAIAHGVDHSRDWPFVSLSSYQQRSFSAKLNSGAIQISIIPYVPGENRTEWEEYIVSDEAEVDWMERSIVYQSQNEEASFITDYGRSFRDDASYEITRFDQEQNAYVTLEEEKESYLPIWETSPFLSFDQVNVDVSEMDWIGKFAKLCLQQGEVVVGEMSYQEPGGMDSPHQLTATFSQLLSISEGKEVTYKGDPMTFIYIPIFDSFEDGKEPTALLAGLFNWGQMFRNVVPDGVDGIDVVVDNTCYDSYTFRVSDDSVEARGRGDLHEAAFNDWERSTDILEKGRLASGTKDGLGFVDSGCYYSLRIYPSHHFADDYSSPMPAALGSLVAVVFLFSIGMFFVYDRLVERRQALVLQKALQSTAIVTSLFPKNVRDRLMTGAPKGGIAGSEAITSFRDRVMHRRRQGSSTQREVITQESSSPMDDSQPIADLFPYCTVMFADISGFTAWSSTRDPPQVFMLLQNLYQAFDIIAVRRKVFKVETIGDSYVAVTGLPDPQQDHAVIMAKFARDCLVKMHEVTQALEVRLGPDTTDLNMRFGLNSGQVTGGVLRGDRARFQLFGDTVNTAARMESTGERGRIQLSQSTADLLVLAGKAKWIQPRKDPVTAKGKGTLQTYWLEIESGRTLRASQDAGNQNGDQIGHHFGSSCELSSMHKIPEEASRQGRLINWMSEVLLDYVKQIVAINKANGVYRRRGPAVRFQPQGSNSICLDEIVETFHLSKDAKENAATMSSLDHDHTVRLEPEVEEQLRRFVNDIALRYHVTNPFHNFDHACHVTMSVHKLMKRVVSDGNDTTEEWSAEPAHKEVVATYGMLTSDPLALFSIVFAGLIHDVDHKGVSNAQLSKEDEALAEHYRHKSIAEQNSFDIAWSLLMSKSYDALRQALFPNISDLRKFRQIVVNTVLATDIFDKQISDLRKERWNRVFGEENAHLQSDTTRDTRVTIVLEHIIQASDVSHTMQHWHVYIKWNRRLFEEMRMAYQRGRMASDPASFWYQGELSFFDNYIIPLAKKLQECQVFGASSNEYLNYALSNRREWEEKGQAMVEEMVNNTLGAHAEAGSPEMLRRSSSSSWDATEDE